MTSHMQKDDVQIEVGRQYEISDGVKAFSNSHRMWRVRVDSIEEHNTRFALGLALNPDVLVRCRAVESPNFLGLCGFPTRKDGAREFVYTGTDFSKHVRLAKSLRETEPNSPYVRPLP